MLYGAPHVGLAAAPLADRADERAVLRACLAQLPPPFVPGAESAATASSSSKKRVVTATELYAHVRVEFEELRAEMAAAARVSGSAAASDDVRVSFYTNAERLRDDGALRAATAAKLAADARALGGAVSRVDVVVEPMFEGVTNLRFDYRVTRAGIQQVQRQQQQQQR